jgi:hypothetical protein
VSAAESDAVTSFGGCTSDAVTSVGVTSAPAGDPAVD